MEIPRHWRLKRQRYNLEGYRVTHTDGTISYEFPPRDMGKKSMVIYNSSLLLPPNDQVVHSEVVGKNQEQNHES